MEFAHADGSIPYAVMAHYGKRPDFDAVRDATAANQSKPLTQFKPVCRGCFQRR